MARLLVLAITVCFLALTPVPARACGCFPSIELLTGKATPKQLVLEEKKRSTAVFSGTVTNIRREKDAYLAVTLKVERTWKQVESEQVTVFTPSGDHACGYNFEVGQSYLVYASSTNDGELWTNHCTRTQRIAADIDNDLKFLGKGKHPKKTNQPH